MNEDPRTWQFSFQIHASKKGSNVLYSLYSRFGDNPNRYIVSWSQQRKRTSYSCE